MPRGYRSAILAAFGLLILTGAAPPHKATPASNTQQQHRPPVSPPAPPAPEYHPYSDRNAEGCYETRDHDAADLCAQWRAAYAAEKAANAAQWADWIAGGGAFLSFVSIVLVFIALRQGREANRIARQTASDQLRPWITCVDFAVHPFQNATVNDVPVKSGLLATLQFKNTGATPAVDVRMFTTFEVGEPESPPHFGYSGAVIEGGRAAALGPGTVRACAPSAVGEEEAQRILAHKAWLYLYCYITYRDPTAPDKLLTTEACQAVHYGGVMVAPDGREIPQFASLAIGEQNRLT